MNIFKLKGFIGIFLSCTAWLCFIVLPACSKKSVAGRKDKLITLKPYQAEKAVISGEGLSVTGSEALVTMNGVSFVTINGYVDGFEVRKSKVYNGENIGIVAAGGYAANSNPAFNYVRNGIIADNEVFTSFAKNTGTVTSALINGTTDKDGQTRIVNNLISKGAYQ